jgi:hypothetical protein
MEKIYLEAFLMYRNFHFFEFAKEIYEKFLKSINLDAYSRQQCDMAMFYLLVMSDDPSVVSKSDLYVKQHEDEILRFKESSLVPWITLISNLRTIYPQDYGCATFLNKLEKKIENELPNDHVNSIRDRILKGRPGGKEELRKGLMNLSRTRSKADLTHEVNQLIVIANRVIETSIAEGDIEGILLGHHLKSDGSISFSSSAIIPSNGLIPVSFDIDEDSEKRFTRYIDHVNSLLSTRSHLQHIWIGINNDKLYCVIYEDSRFTFYGYIESCTRDDIKRWLKEELCELAFIDTPNTGSPLITREDYWRDQSKNILARLPSFDIQLSNSDIVILPDVEISPYPHNLIKSKGKLLSRTHPLSSPLSFDNYIKYNNDYISLDDIYAWAPVCERDMAIEIAYSKLKDNLIDFNINYDEEAAPKLENIKDVNIFICHGGRGKRSGFNGLYPATGKAYISEQMFGRGKIAILFVCHSGSIVKNHYSSSIHSFTKKLLLDGYQAVIAPSWSLNVSIPGIWTKELITSLNDGRNISESVHRANMHVSSIFCVESAWAAMHIFGNGLLKCTQ